MPGIFDYLATNPELYLSFLTMAVMGLAIALGLTGLTKLKTRNGVEAALLLVIGLATGIGFVLLTSTTRFSLKLIEINLFRTYSSEIGFLLGTVAGLVLGVILPLGVNKLLRFSGTRLRLVAISLAVLVFVSFSASASVFLSSVASEKFLPPRYVETYSDTVMEFSFRSNVKSVRDFSLWSEKLTERIAQSLEFPTDAEALKKIREPSYEVLSETKIENIVLAKIRYLAFDGDAVLAYLLRPEVGKDGVKKAGLVVISGHPHSDKGARTLIEDNDDYQQAIALVLARNGYVVIVPELRTFGERAIGTHEAYANYLQMLGKPLAMLWTTEILQATNILRSLSYVDAGRIGTVGISVGGLLAYLSAVFDKGIQATVSASSLVSYLRVSAGFQDLHDQIPMLLKYADYPDVAALIAPRPLFVSYGRKETGIYLYEAETLTSFNYVREAYALLHSEGNLVLDLHDKGQTYDLDATLSFLKKHLAP